MNPKEQTLKQALDIMQRLLTVEDDVEKKRGTLLNASNFAIRMKMLVGFMDGFSGQSTCQAALDGFERVRSTLLTDLRAAEAGRDSLRADLATLMETLQDMDQPASTDEGSTPDGMESV